MARTRLFGVNGRFVSMRVTVITTSYPSAEGDPAGHFVAAEVADLRRDGATVSVVRPRAGGAFGWPGVAARVRERPLRALDAGSWVARACIAVARSRPDRILAHWSVPSAFPIALLARSARSSSAAFLSGVPVDVVSHGGDVRLLLSMPTALRRVVVGRIAARATTWRFVSEALLEKLAPSLERRERAALERIACIAPSPLGDVVVDPSAVGARRAALGGRPLYVCAGRLVASKRVDKVIDYVASTARERDPVLVVLGDGPERSQPERQAQPWAIDVRFLGTMPRPETLSWIGAADEVVFASLAEGLSTVVREAEHLGVKVTKL